jgi:UDP-N-acetylmuramate dehydrogenase
MLLKENVSLRTYNTFGIDVTGRYFGEFSNEATFDEFAKFSKQCGLPLLILGGGSNILFTQNANAVVIRNLIPGIAVIDETPDHVWVKVGSGVVWHDFVRHCIAHNWGGVENLSLIPGSVGAGPMQNIGAYGVELKDVFHSLDAWHINDRAIVSFDSAACEFGYRESTFKGKNKNQFMITAVTFKLSKDPVLNTSYGAIEQELQKAGIVNPTVLDISDAVIRIRRSKLPDPAQIGNAGSFFKNPVIEESQFKTLQQQYSDIVGYPSGASVKVAAGWLIEEAGWKGHSRGTHGVHALQALVLVNYGGATGHEVHQLSSDIIQSVQEKFGITLEREVNIY